MKIFFDLRNLTGIVDEHIDFERSHLDIDINNACVVWVQCLKTSPDEERLIVVESGVVVM